MVNRGLKFLVLVLMLRGRWLICIGIGLQNRDRLFFGLWVLVLLDSLLIIRYLVGWNLNGLLMSLRYILNVFVLYGCLVILGLKLNVLLLILGLILWFVLILLIRLLNLLLVVVRKQF